MIYPTKKQLAKFDAEAFLEDLFLVLDGMRIEEQEAILTALPHCLHKEDFWFLYQYMLAPHLWRMPMVGIDTFIEDEFYL